MTTKAGSSSNRGRHEFTREELLGSTNIAMREWQSIDPERWYDDVEAPNNKVDEIVATTYIAWAIADYTDRPTADDELISEFHQDFEGWTRAMFKRAHTTYTKELKRILRFKGVYTGHLNMSPIEAVFRLLDSEEFPRWPDKQFKYTNFDKQSVAHRLQRELQHGHDAAGPLQPMDTEPARRTQSQASATARDPAPATVTNQASATEQEQRITSQPTNTIEYTPQPDQQQHQQCQQTQQPPSIYNNFDWFREHTPAYPQRPKGTSWLPPIEPSGKTDPYKAVPPIDFSNEKLNATTINAFVKMWDRDKKYTGKPYN
ncbi:hypothetical protein EJ02DRAFT_458670, partial [Clathrospora elynae]